jgi:hypothetical protein
LPEVDSKYFLTSSSNWSEVIFGFFLILNIKIWSEPTPEQSAFYAVTVSGVRSKRMALQSRSNVSDVINGIQIVNPERMAIFAADSFF